MHTNDIVMRDPFVLPFEGKYYLFGTRSFTCWENHATGVDVYVSEDLENWSEPIEVLHKSEDFWADKCYWAPEVHVYKNKFYMFITLSKSGTDILGTSIFVANHPLGPYKPHGKKIRTPEAWRSLDGTFYQDQNGVPYMIFCHEWVQVSDGEMNVVQLNEDLSDTVGDVKVLFRASQGKPWVKNANYPRQINNDYITDGPFLIRTKDGILHMFWASFAQKGYVEAMAHSDNNEIDGNWHIDETLLFDEDGGHGMVFETFDGRYMFALHTPNIFYHEHPAFFEMEYKNETFTLKKGE